MKLSRHIFLTSITKILKEVFREINESLTSLYKMKKEIIGFVFFINVFNSSKVTANLHNVPGHAEKSFKSNHPGR